ncbi:MAG TPA: hypothetical protein EYP61_02060 [Candidatus Latescibacteria bacterium]|nr:hypothetical protein [Candidatus Latescibacterota bacterium]
MVQLIMISLLSASSWAGIKVEGYVEWRTQVIRATGVAAPNPALPLAVQRPAMLEAAKQIALRNLLQIIKGVYINSETTVENAMLKSDVIRSKVEGYIRDFRVLKERYMSDGTLEVDVEVTISDSLREALIPKEEGSPQFLAPEPLPEDYTGLIVDASGLGLRPALAPKVLDEEGHEVYGTKFARWEKVLKVGLVGYASSLKEAKADPRVGDKPLIVEAIRVSGKGNTDPVISSEDALRTHALAKGKPVLAECRVILVTEEVKR